MSGTRIAIVGTGYVGLVTGTCFAQLGHKVICVDKDETKIDLLNVGKTPIYEPGLEELISDNARAGRLKFSVDLPASVRDADAVFVAVGTATNIKNGRADLRYVYDAVEEVARSSLGRKVIVIKSTVPVGTNRSALRVMQSFVPLGTDLRVASNPEFLREGAAVQDFMNPERIVVGTEDEYALNLLEEIYKPIWTKGARFYATGLETAELIKYSSNAFLAVKLSFINQVADLCEAVGGNVEEVAEGMGLDPRIGRSFLKTGPGWGGSCLPKDTLALAGTARDHNVSVSIVEAAIAANNKRKLAMADRIVAALGGTVEGKRIAILGVTFKGGTDDMRDSPSLDIIPALQRLGAKVAAHDPSNPEDARRLLKDVDWHVSPYDAVKGANAAVILTEWNCFESLDLVRLADGLATPLLIDLRNLFSPASAAAAGLFYCSLGRNSVALPSSVTTTSARACAPDQMVR